RGAEEWPHPVMAINEQAAHMQILDLDIREFRAARCGRQRGFSAGVQDFHLTVGRDIHVDDQTEAMCAVESEFRSGRCIGEVFLALVAGHGGEFDARRLFRLLRGSHPACVETGDEAYRNGRTSVLSHCHFHFPKIHEHDWMNREVIAALNPARRSGRIDPEAAIDCYYFIADDETGELDFGPMRMRVLRTACLPPIFHQDAELWREALGATGRAMGDA